MVKNGTSDISRKTYLSFDLSSINGTIVGVELRLATNSVGGSGITYKVAFLANDSWSESAITWNHAPTIGTYSPTIGIGNTLLRTSIITPKIEKLLFIASLF